MLQRQRRQHRVSSQLAHCMTVLTNGQRILLPRRNSSHVPPVSYFVRLYQVYSQ